MIDLPIDYLCTHFVDDGFDSGESLLDEGLHNAVVLPADPAMFVHLVAHEGLVIRGYATVTDTEMAVDDTDERKRCFLVSAIAVDRRYQDSQLMGRLFEGAQDLLKERHQRKAYDALLVFSGFGGKYHQLLKMLGFTESPQPGVWYRDIEGWT